MTATQVSARARAWSRLRTHARVPLHRDGYALALNSGITSVVGLAYWIVAARTYSPALVGLNSALISAMMFVAGIATLNLSNVLVRFLPQAGRGARRFVLACYAVSAATAVVGALIFEVVVAGAPGGLHVVAAKPGLAAGFVAATVCWALFVVQDGALTGLGKAVWVPVENGVFAVAKMALLVVFAALGSYGMFASWAVATGLAVVGVTAVLFIRLLGRAGAARVAVGGPGFAAYLVADWLCAMAWLAATTLLPVVVTAVAGAAENATFALAWALAFPLHAIAANLGLSLVLHGTREPAALPGLVRKTARQGLALLVAPVVLAVLAAPLALSLFGGSYAGDGATLLRLLALGAVPNLVLVLWVSAARVRRRLRGAIVALGAQAAITLASVIPLLHGLGVTGAGVAWLGGQCVVAAGVLATVAWRRRPRGADAGAAALVGRTPLRPIHTDSDVAVLAAGATWIVKLGASERGAARLAAHRDAIRRLRATRELAGWSALLPPEVAGGDGWLVEAVLPGTDGRLLPHDEVLGATVAALRPLYAATATEAGAEDVARWLDARAARLASLAPAVRPFVERVEADLAGSGLLAGWVHGDLWAGNVLLTADASRVTGIVDWEHAEPDGLPAADMAHLVISSRALASGRGLGTVVRRLADGRDELSWGERAALAAACPPGERLDAATAARLGWLQHVYLRLGQVTPHPRGMWARRTVRPVLTLDAPPRGRWARRTVRPVPALGAPARARAAASRLRAASRRGGWARRTVRPVPALGAPPRARAAWSRLRAAPRHGRALDRARASSSRLRTALTPPRRDRARAASTALALAPVAVALALWAGSLRGVDLDAMTDAGLMSVLPASFVAALVVLTLGFAAALARRRVGDLVPAAHALTLIAILHATPSILYGTLRYGWAWKHVGIVDFIQRHGTVDAHIGYLTAYHDWPGFFALGALATDASGRSDALGIAQWGPPFFNLLFLGGVLLIARTRTSDARVIWAAGWLFLLGNWVGQDYFSPQALCFFLYLAVVAVLLRARVRDRAAVTLALVLSGAVVMSHQLTPLMLVVGTAAITFVHRRRQRWLPFAIMVMTATWIVLFARPFLEQNLYWIVDSIGSPSNNAAQGLRSLAAASPGMVVTAWAGRALTAAIIGLAFVGFVRRRRHGTTDRPVALLAICPIVLLAATSYSGEIVFRVFLFGLPFLALFAAWAFFPARRPRVAAAALAVSSLALLAGTCRAYYGKEPMYRFSPSEVAVMQRFYDTAPRGALMMSGTFDYPWAFRGYERYDYAALETEPAAVRRRVVADPVTAVTALLQTRSAAYFIVTRSQEAAVDMTGVLPAGTLRRAVAALVATGTPDARAARPERPWFSVAYRADDAIILELHGGAP